MPPIKNILFPIDFTERTTQAAPFVAAFMNGFCAHATLLHVVEPLPYICYAEAAPVALDYDALQCEAQAYLEQSLVREFRNLPVKRRVEIGAAAGTITRIADTEHADLIMMPTHGYGPFRSFLLGSVTSRVLHDARCPVWTATHAEQSPLKEHLPCRSVLCAVDGSGNSLAVLRWADDFARNLGASLRVLHVIPGASEWMLDTMDQDRENELRKHARVMIEKLLASAAIDVPICIGVGEVAQAIKTEAITHGMDLLVIGRGVLHEKLGRLRAHSYEIIRTAPCPVISV